MSSSRDLLPSSFSSLDEYLSSQRPLLLNATVSDHRIDADEQVLPQARTHSVDHCRGATVAATDSNSSNNDNDGEADSWTTEEEDLATSSGGVSWASTAVRPRPNSNRRRQFNRLRLAEDTVVYVNPSKTPKAMGLENSPTQGRHRLLVPILIAVIVFLLITIIGLIVAVVVLGRKSNKPSTVVDDGRTTTPTTLPTTTTTGSSGLNPPNDPYHWSANNRSAYHTPMMQPLETQSQISAQMISSFDPMNIRDNLRWMSNKLHVAGTPENTELMYKLANEHRLLGFDVKTIEYDVLLNFPDYNRPNTIEVMEENTGNWQQLSDGLAERLGPKEALDQEADSRMLVWWLAYAANGTATGQLVYANYGTLDDYLTLDQYGVNLTGKIVMCRYGGVWRGSKVVEAERRGAVGVIIYSDPADYTAFDGKTNQTFPDQVWMPPSGAQRGTLSGSEGDLETPYFPSKSYAYRTESLTSLRQSRTLPKVPATPIGYRDAIKIMSRLDGQEVGLPSWRGGMNVVYRLSGSANFRLSVSSTFERRTVVDVVATMRGIDEPDRLVILGNHVDAWVKGSIDPNSGTATMLEMARVLSSISNSTGWRPRRSIAFCYWDAEEYGVIGSTEYVEEFLKPLQARAIAYINVDNINGNTTLSTKGVPLLYRILVDAAQKVKNPNIDELNAGRATVLDSWKYYTGKGPLVGDQSVPQISLPDSGSDFERFIGYAGIPVVDLKFVSAPKYTYMLYHTMYEIPWTVENLVDTQFTTFTAAGQIMLEIGRNLADSLVIPFNVVDYGLMLTDFVSKMEAQLTHSGIIAAIGIDDFVRMLKNLRDAVDRFQSAGDKLQAIVATVNTGRRPITVRQAEMLNSRLVALERAFVSEQGIYPERAFYRHVVFTISLYDMYTGVTFAVIMDPAVDWRNAVDAGDIVAAQHWLETVKVGFTKVNTNGRPQYTVVVVTDARTGSKGIVFSCPDKPTHCLPKTVSSCAKMFAHMMQSTCFGNATNFTQDPHIDDTMLYLHKIYFGYTTLPVVVAGLLVASVFFVSVLRAMRYHRVSRKCYVLLLDRTAGDLLACLAGVVMAVYVLCLETPINPNVSIFLETLLIGSVWSAMVSYASLSLLKLFAVARPLSYRRMVTLKSSVFIIKLSWTVYLTLVFSLWALAMLIKDRRISGILNCKPQQCLQMVHRARIVLHCLVVLVCYSLTLSSFAATAFYVRRARNDFCKLKSQISWNQQVNCGMRYSMYKLSLHVATFALVNAAHCIYSLIQVFHTDPCLYEHKKVEMFHFYSIARTIILLRIIIDPVLGFFTDSRLRQSAREGLHLWLLKRVPATVVDDTSGQENTISTTASPPASPTLPRKKTAVGHTLAI